MQNKKVVNKNIVEEIKKIEETEELLETMKEILYVVMKRKELTIDERIKLWIEIERIESRKKELGKMKKMIELYYSEGNNEIKILKLIWECYSR